MTESETKARYWAFISYSSIDTAIARRLHSKLETYRIPRDLVGRPGRDEPVSRRIFPIFRDRDELPLSADLGSSIEDALRASRYLIVLCSPDSATSRWVNEEIRYFKSLGREDRVLAIILRGEPNATDKPGQEELECFAPALRHRIGPDGQLTADRTEPIAGDLRKGGDGWRDAFLKAVAGITGLGFDDLVQRDARRTKRRQFVAGCASLAVVAILSTALAVAISERRGRQAANTQRDQEEAAKLHEEATIWLERAQAARRNNQPLSAIAFAARALRDPRITPHNDSAQLRNGSDERAIAESIINSCPIRLDEYWPSCAHHDAPINAAVFSDDGTIIASGDDSGWLRIWSLAEGTALDSYHFEGESITALDFSADGAHLAVGNRDAQVHLVHLKTRDVTEIQFKADYVSMPIALIDMHAIDQPVAVQYADQGYCLAALSGVTEDPKPLAWGEFSARIATATSRGGTGVHWAVGSPALNDRRIWVARADDRQNATLFELPARAESMRFASHGRALVAASAHAVDRTRTLMHIDLDSHEARTVSTTFRGVITNTHPSGHAVYSIVGTCRIGVTPLDGNDPFFLDGQSARIRCIDAHATTLLSAGDDGYLYLWDLDTRTLINRPDQLSAPATSLAHPSSTTGISSTATGHTLVRPGHGSRTRHATEFTPRRAFLSEDGSIMTWVFDDGVVWIETTTTQPMEFRELSMGVFDGVAASPDGQWVAVATELTNAPVRVLSRDENTSIHEIEVSSPVGALSFTRTGDAVVTLPKPLAGLTSRSVARNDPSNTIKLLNGVENQPFAQLPMPREGYFAKLITASCACPIRWDNEVRIQGTVIVASQSDLWIYDRWVYDGQPAEPSKLTIPELDAITALDVDRDGLWIAIGDARGRIAIFDVQADRHEIVHFHGDAITALRLFDNGTRLCAGDARGAVSHWTLEAMTTLQAHIEGNAAFPQGNHGVHHIVIQAPHTVRLVNTGSGSVHAETQLDLQFGPTRRSELTPVSFRQLLAASSDGSRIAVSDGSGHVKIGVLSGNLQTHVLEQPISAIGLSPDGARAFVGLNDGSVTRIDETDAMRHLVDPHEVPISALHIAPNDTIWIIRERGFQSISRSVRPNMLQAYDSSGALQLDIEVPPVMHAPPRIDALSQTAGVITQSQNPTLIVYNLDDVAELVRIIVAPEFATVSAFDVARDRTGIAMCIQTLNGTLLRIYDWDATTPRCEQIIEMRGGDSLHIALDQTHLAIASGNGIDLYDTEFLARLGTIHLDTPVVDLEIDANGLFVMTSNGAQRYDFVSMDNAARTRILERLAVDKDGVYPRPRTRSLY
ncbi:MAG: toll/interleukin-1 receptor domain-containing protein [Phycisphaerales bacterium]